MKKGFGQQSSTNWSGAGASLLMSLRQDETNRHKCMKLRQAGSQKSVNVRAQRVAPLHERV